MKATANRLSEERRSRAKAAVEEHVVALFRRMPMLAGFSLRDNLELTDVAIHSWPGYSASQDLYDELMQALVDLAEERPETVELLRGRTFARALH